MGKIQPKVPLVQSYTALREITNQRISTNPKSDPYGTSSGDLLCPMGYMSQPTLVAMVLASIPTASMADLALQGWAQGLPRYQRGAIRIWTEEPFAGATTKPYRDVVGVIEGL